MQNVRTQPKTVIELADLAEAHALRRYRNPETGKPTRHHYNWRYGMQPLAELFTLREPANLTAPDFQAAQDWLVDLGKCNRQTINDRMRHMRSALSWASKRVRGYIPKTVLLEAQEVEDLKPGQSSAAEPGPRRIATPQQIETVTAFATTLYLAQMVQVHAMTGMRSSELTRMRRTWIKPIEDAPGMLLYQPAQHKTQRHGKERQIVIGPKATDILLDHMRRVPEDQDTLWPITTAGSYYQAIHRACLRAKMPEPITALMIRRYAGFTIRREYGLDAAQQALGHSDAKTTQLYAPPDLSKLIAAMRANG